MPTQTRSASGVGVFPSIGSTASTTNRAPGTIDDQRIAEIIGLTLEETPPVGAHGSLRSMARASGYAPSTIHRILRTFGLQPHRSETFKVSADPLFVDKAPTSAGCI